MSDEEVEWPGDDEIGSMLRNWAIRDKLDQLRSEGRVHTTIDRYLSPALDGVAVMLAERAGRALENELSEDDTTVLFHTLMVARLMTKLADDIRAGVFSVAMRPSDGDVFWTIPGLDEPDADGRCKCCGAVLQFDDGDDDEPLD